VRKMILCVRKMILCVRKMTLCVRKIGQDRDRPCQREGSDLLPKQVRPPAKTGQSSCQNRSVL
jgi:hypothetical protein